MIQRNVFSLPVGKGVNENLPATRKWPQFQELQRYLWVKFETDYLGNLKKRYKCKTLGKKMGPGKFILLKESGHSLLN